MNSSNKCLDRVGTHIGIDAMAQVHNVLLGAELINHLVDQFCQCFLILTKLIKNIKMSSHLIGVQGTWVQIAL